MRSAWAGALVGLWMLVGCSSAEPPADGGLVVRDGGQVADTGVGQDAAPADTGVADDAGFVDAGTPDSGMEPDAGEQDAGAVDTGVDEDAGVEDTGSAPVDAGGEDAAVADAGEVEDGGPADTGAPADGGPLDAGSPDAAPVDTGVDAGTPDTGTPDTGIPDTGIPDAGLVDSGVADGGVVVSCNPSFGVADACGGAALGTWTYQSACSDQVPFADVVALCPAATVANVVRVASGTLTLNPNGTYARAAMTTLSGDAFVPQVCVSGGGLTCAQLGGFLPFLITGATGSCVQAAAGCDCQITVATQLNDTGQFFANGNVVTTVSGGATRDYWYCAQGGTLEYRGLPTNPTDNDTTYVLTP
jgi:hypothetical protein